MRLKELLLEAGEATGPEIEIRGDAMVEVRGLTYDSRRVAPGDLFVAMRGLRQDGHAFISEAVARGAVGVVMERGHMEIGGVHVSGAPVALVPDARLALARLADRFYGRPSRRLGLIGVTGTNGKTTTTYLAKAVLEAAGKRVGLIGTIAYQIGSEVLPASHTTPESADVQRLLSRMVTAGADYAVMEVSSHALALGRVEGCGFDVAVFTNLTQDHLDFHGTLDDYFQAKLRLFTGLGRSASRSEPAVKPGVSLRAMVNADDPRAVEILRQTAAPSWTYGVQTPADISIEGAARGIRSSLDGLMFTVATPAGRLAVESRLVGLYNAANILAAIGVGVSQGVPLEAVRQGIRSVECIPGRFEKVEAGQPYTVVVDYAHTEDALRRLLTTAAEVSGGARLITVFGCGGDRDRGKRPLMGRAAAELSTEVVLTSDNPRTEDPLAIMRDVEAGIRSIRSDGPRYQAIPDRREAIATALGMARAGDIVLIAGKGHETDQIIGATRIPFDDRAVAREWIQEQGC